MDLVNQTPFQFIPLAGRIEHPKHSLTIIVKGTFNLAHGAPAAIAEPQLPIIGDEPYPDDESGTRGPRYESDLAPHKPNADLLLVGTCHPPGGLATQMCEVTFRVGTTKRTLLVIGDRRWLPGAAGPTVSEARRFTEMPLRYERSFGGKDIKANPTGRGRPEESTEGGGPVKLLPNIEDPANLVTTPGSRPDPAGFGPLSRSWEHRASKIGTYGEKWFKTRSPWFPADMDWAVFNAAPPPLRVAGFLKGDEEIQLVNLHPEHADFRARLPGLRLRCFINTLHRNALKTLIPTQRPDATPEDAAAEFFGEIPMNLDTLWIDAEAGTMILAWRGHAEALSDEYEELRGLFLTTEPVAEPARSLDECRVTFLAELAAINAEWEEPEEPDEEELAEAEVEAKPVDAEEDETDREIRKNLLAAGVDPTGPAPPTPEQQAEMDRLVGDVDLEDDEAVDAHIAKSLGEIRASRIKAGSISPAEMQIIKAEEEEAAARKAAAQSRPDPSARLTREGVEALLAEGESLAGRDLGGLDLSGLDLQEVDLSGANLAGANLREAKLAEADLSGADLSKVNAAGADLTEADLSEATLVGAVLTGACLNGASLRESDLSGADLSGAQMEETALEEAVLEQAVLDGVAATGAFFTEANLAGASLKGGTFDQAELSRATLSQADFTRASIRDALLEEVVAIEVRLTGADLSGSSATGGDFSNAALDRLVGAASSWTQCVLDGADFTSADMPEADFTKASMLETNLFAADLKSACFRKANLTGARLVQVNLFLGNMEYANLTRADISGSNMYGVEFHDAIVHETKAAGTNLRKTQLQSG